MSDGIQKRQFFSVSFEWSYSFFRLTHSLVFLGIQTILKKKDSLPLSLSPSLSLSLYIYIYIYISDVQQVSKTRKFGQHYLKKSTCLFSFCVFFYADEIVETAVVDVIIWKNSVTISIYDNTLLLSHETSVFTGESSNQGKQFVIVDCNQTGGAADCLKAAKTTYIVLLKKKKSNQLNINFLSTFG